MLQHYKVTPIMVFDGANLPSKSGTERDRHSSRAENKSKGMQALRADNRSAAVEYFQRAVDVTPLMAHKCIKALRKIGVECIVAPYEADAQAKAPTSPYTPHPNPYTLDSKPQTLNPLLPWQQLSYLTNALCPNTQTPNINS